MNDAYSRKIAFHTCTAQPHNAQDHERGIYPVANVLDALHGFYSSSHQKLTPATANAAAILRICDMDMTPDGAVFLITFSSPLASDPAFQDQVNGSVRVASRNQGEAPAVAAHVWVSKAPMPKKLFENLMLIEKVPGLGTTRIMHTLNHLAKPATPVLFTDSAGNTRKTWLELSLQGLQSKTLGEMLKTGKLVGVDLVEYDIPRVKGIDAKTATPKRRVTTFTVNPNTPLDVVAEFFGLAKRKNKEARVRIRYEGRYETEVLDTGRDSALETLFVKSETIRLNKGIPECTTKIHRELVGHMKQIASRFI